jgi:hypothetical protein
MGVKAPSGLLRFRCREQVFLMRNSVPPVFLPSQVVVIEDDPAVRGALFAALRLEGCAARTSETQVLGAEEALVDRPGVVVFEYALPWTDAHAIVEQLRLLMRPAPSLILLSDPRLVVESCETHGIPVFPMNPPKVDGGIGVSASASGSIRHTRVLTVDCPDRAEQFLKSIEPVPVANGSMPPPSSIKPSLLVVRHARSAARMRVVTSPTLPAVRSR